MHENPVPRVREENKVENIKAVQEKEIKLLPIIQSEDLFVGDDLPQFTEDGVIVAFEQRKGKDTTKNFGLQKTIHGLTYHFFLQQAYDEFYLDFRTKEYGYAITNLPKEGHTELIATCNAFLESVYQGGGVDLSRVFVSPHTERYTKEEIDICAEEIAEAYPDYGPVELIVGKYNAKDIFSLYRQLFRHDFERRSKIPRKKNDRAAVFGKMIARYLSQWEIEKSAHWDDFTIVRKE